MASAMACLVLSTGFALTSCSDDDDEFGTNQYIGGVTLNVFGPSPVARGGELRFLGSGLDQIQSVTLPGSGDITDINKISANEIRITVPQTAEPGYVVLHHAGGDIKTATLLTFTEPISIESVAPLAVKAGDEITIKGDYLNLIHEVLFADEVAVAEEDFTSHSRYEISLRVPAEAQSGKIIVSDAAEMPNWIYSDEELTVALPTVEKVLDLTGAKPGDEINVKGSNLDLVTRVIMPNEDEVEFTVKGNVLTFILPENVTDGTICIIPASGVKVAAATIGVAVPEEVVADPATDLWAGDVIKIKGVNMELVNTVTFPGVADAVEPDSKSATEITVTIPDGFISGNAILTTGSGAEVEVAVSTVKPAGVVYDPATASLAGPLTVKGVNLDHVKAIRFAGNTDVAVENPTATEFAIIVPATLEAGSNEVALVLTNGEVVEAPALELTAPECAYATALPGEEVEIPAGGTFVVTIGNPDKLTAVKVNGQEVQYILNGTTLIIQVPASAGKSSNFTLVSSNGEISYDIAVIPQTHVGMTIWEGMWTPEGWAGNQDLAWGGYDWSQVPAGAILTIYFTPVNPSEWYFFGLRHGNGWGSLPGARYDQIDNPEGNSISFELSAEELADLVANGGLVIVSNNTVMSKVTIEWEVSLEVDVFGDINQDMGSWSINYELKPNDAFVTAGLRPGMKLNFYLTPTADYCQLQTFDGHWGPLTWAEANDTNNFNSDMCDMKKISVVVTPEIHEKLTTYIDWGYCMILQGENVIVNKITIE